MSRRPLTSSPPSRGWVSVPFPAASQIGTNFVERASLVESYRFQLASSSVSVVDIFLCIFGGKPFWMKAGIILRNLLVKPFGLVTPSVSDILSDARRPTYKVGEKIWAWPIFALTENELIAGRNNRHMDFRVSVLKSLEDGRQIATVSTVCVTHNLAGDAYLKAILPIHTLGIRFLIERALAGPLADTSAAQGGAIPEPATTRTAPSDRRLLQ